MTKQISMKILDNDNKKYNQQEQFTVNAQDDEFTVKFYPYFSPTKINSLLNEVAAFLDNAKKEKLNLNTEDEFDHIIGYYIVRTFTNIKTTTSKKAKTIYEEIKIAKDSVLFDLIINTIPEESIKSVYDKLFEARDMVAKLEKTINTAKEKLKDLPLENKELLFGKEKQIPEV